MDTFSQGVTAKREYRSLEENRRIVEETLAEGTSVALVARAHGVNTNLVFNWRKRYRAARLGGGDGAVWSARLLGCASLSVHSSLQNCYASSRSISLSTVIAP
jgi:transposase-like protein